MGRSQARPCPWTSRDDFGMLPAWLPGVLPTLARRPGRARTVHQGDALPWLRAAGTLAGASVVTSLPDVSELPGLGLDGWRRWFEEAAVLTMQSRSRRGRGDLLPE